MPLNTWLLPAFSTQTNMILQGSLRPTRLEILKFLRLGEKCVCEITLYVGLIQFVVSRHLRILKECGLVIDRKDGNRGLCLVTDSKVFGIIDAVNLELMDTLSKRMIEQMI